MQAEEGGHVMQHDGTHMLVGDAMNGMSLT